MHVYLAWSLALLGVWAVVYFARAVVRRKMLAISALTGALGLTEPIFVPRYWHPPTLFGLAERTGFDIESLIFAFAAGGLASVLYDAAIGQESTRVHADARLAPRHRWHRWALATPVPVFIALFGLTSLNPIYIASLSLVAGGGATVACRPDLLRRMAAGAGIFLVLYLVYFLSLVTVYPAYVGAVRHLPALSGVLILGIPLEELLFAISLGWMWSGVYEHVAWPQASDVGATRVHMHGKRR